MPTFDEAKPQSQLAAALGDGRDTLDLNQEIKFRKYTRVVLPLDGYVFWQPVTDQCFRGSLHYSQDIQQNADETYGLASVTFTAKCRIVEFSESPTNVIWVGAIGGFRFAFSQQMGFFDAASLWHYQGQSIPPAMLSMLLDNPTQIANLQNQAIVSNSIPLWLGLNNYPALYPDFFSNDIPLFPAYLVPANMQPPYGAVDVTNTRTVQSAPYIDPRTRSHWQAAVDTVEITLYGLNNNQALDFQDCVNQYSTFTENFGVMNMPIVMDPHRGLTALETLAQKKVIQYEVYYQQTRVQTIALQLIESATVNIIFPDQGQA